MNILIADDDEELCSLLKEYLEQEGLSVQTAPDGQSAIELLKTQDFDLLVLDVMMPKLNGFDTLKLLRESSDIAIIMLTAKGEKLDRIAGLEMGADDYISKPCDPLELIARIRAVTRRSLNNKSNKLQEDVIKLDDITVLKTSRQVMLGNQYVDFTSTEFDVLLVLIEKAGELISREKLCNLGLRKPLEAYDRHIDMHISHLRKKLGLDSQGRKRIETIRGTGYQYVVYPSV